MTKYLWLVTLEQIAHHPKWNPYHTEASLAHPLPHSKAVLYAKLFREILPNTPVADEVAQLATMAYDSGTERELADLAQKTRAPDRKPKKESEWRTPPA